MCLRRVACPRCGVKVERTPWAEGKNHLTTTYAWFLAKWAKRLSWKEVAAVFTTSWDNVFRSVKMAVAWGLAPRDLGNVTAIGIDEIAWKRGHKYLTLVYQVDAGCRRLLRIGKERTAKTLKQFFKEFGPERTSHLEFICSDMWQPYLRVVAEVAGKALHILDRFHLMTHFGKAIDKVRATEAKELKAKGKQPVLTGTRWFLLKRPDNLTDKQTVKLKELLAINLKSVRAYLLKEDFDQFWRYKSAEWAGRFLDDWCRRTHHAFSIEAYEEDSPDAAHPPRVASQLVPGQKEGRFGRCRGFQQQGESDLQKSVRLQELRCYKSCLISHAWGFART